MTVRHGDCLDLMREMGAEGVASIVTDPPYGLSFMGKGWDHGVPGVEFWTEALRVAKPGAYLLAFGGTRTYHRMACAIEDAGWHIQDCLSWLYGSGFPKHKSKLKPAWEPIVMAWKPDARATHLNIDGCRIEGPAGDGVWGTSNATVNPDRTFNRSPSMADYRSAAVKAEGGEVGRWPANVLLDEEAAAALDAQSGELPAGTAVRHRAGGNSFGGATPKPPMDDLGYGDTGGASRFFYCAKASRSEREAGLEGMEERPGASENHGTKAVNLTRKDGGANVVKPARNHHPTVKPVALMRWLVRLVTPAGGTVLDPFAGSGTTGVACAHEGFDFIGCEREAEYVEIARRRIAHALATHQPDLGLIA